MPPKEPIFTGAGLRQPAPPPPEPTPLSLEQKAARALETQGRPQTLVAVLSEAQREALAATLDANDLATADEVDAEGKVTKEGTSAVVTRLVMDYYESLKATDASLEEGAAPDPARGLQTPPKGFRGDTARAAGSQSIQESKER